MEPLRNSKSEQLKHFDEIKSYCYCLARTFTMSLTDQEAIAMRDLNLKEDRDGVGLMDKKFLVNYKDAAKYCEQTTGGIKK
jgi:hypothetical protein